MPVSMIELFDPVLIKNDDGAARYYNAQLGLRIKMLPHLFRIHSDLEVTCISHVGRPSGNDVLESRAKWLIRSRGGDRRITTGSSNKWPDQDNGRERKKENGRMEEDDEEEDEDDYDEVDDDDDIQVGRQDEEKDRNATFHHSGFDDGDDDGTAQSISDSESPSRRTQPVVGSYPGNVFIIIRPPQSEEREGDKLGFALQSPTFPPRWIVIILFFYSGLGAVLCVIFYDGKHFLFTPPGSFPQPLLFYRLQQSAECNSGSY